MMLQGFRVRLFIAGRPFVAASFAFSDECESIDCSNSEGVPGDDDLADEPAEVDGGFSRLQRMGGRSGARLEVGQATLLTNEGGNPFLTPFSLRSRQRVEVLIYPDRRGAFRHRIPSLLVTRVSHEGEVSALQPIRIEGESDSTYVLYERG